MKKQILNLGKTLNKLEQRSINGGFSPCISESDCRNSPLHSGGPVACILGHCVFAWNE